MLRQQQHGIQAQPVSTHCCQQGPVKLDWQQQANEIKKRNQQHNSPGWQLH
jgi:hypothetical protein